MSAKENRSQEPLLPQPIDGADASNSPLSNVDSRIHGDDLAAPSSAPRSEPEAYQELQLPLSTFDGSDWTPWVGDHTHDQLKARIATAILAYTGPQLDVTVGDRRLELGGADRELLLQAVARCPETQGEQLADIWRLVRSQDTSAARADSRSWPGLTMAQRVQQAAVPAAGRSVSAIGLAATAVGGLAWSAAGGRSWDASRDASRPINEPIWPRPAVPGKALELHVVRRAESLWSWRSRWDELRTRSDLQGAEFETVLKSAQDTSQDFALLALGHIQHPVAMLALSCRQVDKRFTLGERCIGRTTVRQASFIGGHALGDIDSQRLAQLLNAARSSLHPDLFKLPEIETASPSYQAVRGLSWPYVVSSPSRTDQLHWTIELPASFDAYLEQLSSKTRQSIRYSLRKAQRDLKPSFERISQPEQVDAFLQAAEGISRQTYQWQVGDRVVHNPSMRAEYLRRAHEGSLRAYLMRVDGVPVAFARGELRGDRYDYETPGYLPEYGKWSVGTVLLMHSIEDLIGKGEARIFDFGEGGDTHGYKSRFGNHSTPVRALDVARLNHWRGTAVVLLQGSLCAVKNLAQRLMGESNIKKRIKAWLRR